jgi:sugar lactone lactonase YvrE
VINDVALTRDGAWFTDSTHPVLYFVPLVHDRDDDEGHRSGDDDADDEQRAEDHADEGQEHESQRHHDVPGAFSTLPLSGPAAQINGQFSLNGIAATRDGKTLVVAHTGNESLYTVDPATGASALIAGVSVPNVDGILLDGHRLWAVQNFSNQISLIRLSADLSSGVVERVITDSAFEVPTTAAKHGNRLAVINAKFDTGFPPTADQYEVVIVRA